MPSGPTTHVMSVIAQALLMDEKKPQLHEIYSDLEKFLQKEYPELSQRVVDMRNHGHIEDNILESYMPIMNAMLLEKIPGLHIGTAIFVLDDIKKIHKKFGVTGLDGFDKVNQIRDELRGIIDKHFGTMKELELFR